MQTIEKNVAPPCDCCGSSQWEYRFRENGFDLGRCTNCGLYYLLQMPPKKNRASADAQHASPTRARKNVEISLKAKFRHLCSLVQKSAPPGKWLDIGCGHGALIVAAMELGIEIEGVEPMQAAGKWLAS